MAHVEVEVKILVVHPIRMVEVEWHFGQATTERLNVADHRRKLGVHMFERIPVRRRSTVDAKTIHMAKRGWRFHIEKAGIESGELLHYVSSSGCRSW